MSWFISIPLILLGIALIIKPDTIVRQKNQKLKQQGKKELSTEEKIKYHLRIRIICLFVVLCGGIILLADILTLISG
ncbi:MAG: hypothetical protein FWC47_16160 [Oscillospiraceae bacterium]|nr:hypothetical protein [Oscillospiraceae bacterium]